MSKKYILIGILLLAAILRLGNLSSGDITGSDEVFYAFRAVGLLDFDNAPAQTTPLQWLDPSASSGQIPWWMRLSFHDHPPLVFWIQHLFIKIFGENNFAFRFPSAILSIVSVYLLYLIGGQLFSRRAGLVAAAIMAVTVNSVWISRVGLQEAYVIFFVLLAIYFFLRALDKNSYFIWTGIAIGLAGLAKYTALVIVPIFLTYLLFFKRGVFRQKKIWLGAAMAVLIFGPVIIYNINLYRAVGHFDFQFSYIFGQRPEVWQVAPGKEIGTLADRLRQFVPNLAASNGYGFLSFFAAAILIFLFVFFKKTAEILRVHAFLVLTFLYLFLMLMLIGPSFRFLAIFTPFIALTNAIFLTWLYEKFFAERKRAAYAVLGAFLLSAALYSINSQILAYPIGPESLIFSKVRYENYNWGYNQLDKFLQKELSGKYPALNFRLQYQFLEAIKNKSIEKARAAGFKPYPALIVYDSNIQQAAQLWSLDRPHIYHGWPVIKTETYLSFLEEQGVDYFQKTGVKNYYFIIPTDKVPLKKAERLTSAGALFEQKLKALTLEPIQIFNKRSEEVFRIYKFGPI